ncbi:MAG: HAD-IA family hydrolase [Nitrospirae bacterium]|nr:HAD-IA family hydrolase [Nitrospirota bacterium]
MIKLIIFDLDGTLVDSSIDLTNALNYAIEPYALEKLTEAQTKRLVGEGITKLLENLLGPERLAMHAPTLVRFMDYYSSHLLDHTAPYPGVAETLANLRNYKKAVISNKREALSTEVLQGLGLLQHFDAVLGSDSTGQKKPSPMPLLKVMQMLSVGPEETVIIGDSNFDIEAGKAAGTVTCAVTYGYRDAALLQDADFIIDTFPEILEIVAGR